MWQELDTDPIHLVIKSAVALEPHLVMAHNPMLMLRFSREIELLESLKCRVWGEDIAGWDILSLRQAPFSFSCLQGFAVRNANHTQQTSGQLFDEFEGVMTPLLVIFCATVYYPFAKRHHLRAKPKLVLLYCESTGNSADLKSLS